MAVSLVLEKCRKQSDLILQWGEEPKQQAGSFAANRNTGVQFSARKF